MTVTITAFDWVPEFAEGLVRDIRVRWALEEVGEAYDVRYLSQGEQNRPPHIARQPFEQVPTFEEEGLVLFESGAIVHHIANTRPGLLPADPAARARAVAWMFAALNTVELRIADFQTMVLFEADKPWAKPRRPVTVGYVRDKLAQLSDRLGEAEWLDGDFSAGDLMMVAVLDELRDTKLLDEHANVAAYVARGKARPAYQRAHDAQLAGFTGSPPPGWAEQEAKIKQAQGESA